MENKTPPFPIENKKVSNIRPIETNETNETQKQMKQMKHNGFVSFVTCYKEYAGSIFGDNALEKVLKFLAENKGDFTYDKIAEKVGKSEGTVRLAIHRNKEFFLVTKPNGKICNTSLKQTAVDEILDRIEQKKEQIEERNKLLEEEKKRQEIERNYENEVASFLMENKMKREGKNLLFDFKILSEQNSGLSLSFLNNPGSFIKFVKSFYHDQLDIKIINMPYSNHITIESIRKEHCSKIISLDGRVVSFGEVNQSL